MNSLSMSSCKHLGMKRCRGSGAIRTVSKAVVDGEEKTQKLSRNLRVGLICGGPSAERGISLSSARSILHHLQDNGITLSCYYIDPDLQAFSISPAQVYSNTPADFDFKLER